MLENIGFENNKMFGLNERYMWKIKFLMSLEITKCLVKNDNTELHLIFMEFGWY